MNRWRRLAVVAALLALLLVLGVSSVIGKSMTYDEANHYRYGQQILEGDSSRFDDSKMPFSALNALPFCYASRRPPGMLRDTVLDPRFGRVVTILVSACAGLLVWHWGARLYGFWPGVLALVLYTLDPNVIAHSQLITTDLYALFTILAASYAFWRFGESRTWRWAILAAVALGVAQLAKYTAVFLFPLFAVMALLRDGRVLRRWIRRRERPRLRRYAAVSAAFLALFAAVSLLIVNAGFLFNRTGLPLSRYAFRSDEFRRWQQTIVGYVDPRVPVPYPYLEGLDWVLQRERTGEGYGSIYLLGQLRQGRGFLGYYLWAYLFKVPIAIQLLHFGALAACWRLRNRPGFSRRELYLIAPVLFFSLYFNTVFRAQIGIRFILIIFPFLHILAGGLAAGWRKWVKPKRLGFAMLLLYLLASVLSYFPHYIPYFNELVIDRRMAYLFLADSNLDWGQAAGDLAAYRQAHPEAIFEPDRPMAGTIVVPVNGLVGLGTPEEYRWLRDHFRPSGTIAYAYLVYTITPEMLEALEIGPKASGL